jgi:hypothetical protein
MKILIIGFQRSGTTLTRRLFHMHPQVRRIFHEFFLINKCKTKKELLRYINRQDINPHKENWGEKAPFYPNIRKTSVIEYCKTWNNYFGEQSRILHIVRHPADTAFSSLKKNKIKQDFDEIINMYNLKMTTLIPEMSKMKNVYLFKYEELLSNPDYLLPDLYKFCGLKEDINFKKIMSKFENKKYRKFDSSRIFAYKKKNPEIKTDLTNLFDIINSNIPGPKYEV